MTERQVRQIVLWTENLDDSVQFYNETLGFPLKFRDGNHYAALDCGGVTIALATESDHPIPGQIIIGIKTEDPDGDAEAVSAAGGVIARQAYDGAHERRAVVYDGDGNGIVFYKTIER